VTADAVHFWKDEIGTPERREREREKVNKMRRINKDQTKLRVHRLQKKKLRIPGVNSNEEGLIRGANIDGCPVDASGENVTSKSLIGRRSSSPDCLESFAIMRMCVDQVSMNGTPLHGNGANVGLRLLKTRGDGDTDSEKKKKKKE